MTGFGGRTAVFIAIAVIVAIGPVSAGIAADGVSSSSATPRGDVALSPPQVDLVQNDDDSDDNDTVRHRNPDEYDEDGNPGIVERQLADQLTGNLRDGAIQLSEGEYDRASQYVGEEYRESLGQYVEVAGETDDESQAERFESAREDLERTTETVEQYNETKAEYEEAREEGDEERARELARDLEKHAETVDESSEQMDEHYDALEAETGENLSESEAAIEAVNEEIQREQEDIRQEEFVQTKLEIDHEDEEISFLEPLVARGELRTVDEEPVTNESIRLEIGNGSVRTETDSNGTFAFEYRPTAEPLSIDQLEIRYVPDSGSIYLGDETAVDVSIEQVEPTASDLEASDDVTYGENASIEGDLHVDDVPVDDVSLAVTLENERIGTAEVSNGSFDGAGEVPASVADGERELGVELDGQENGSEDGDTERALADVPSTATVTVLETESHLSISASRTDGTRDRTVAVNGTLETADGEGVPGERVQLLADGAALESVTTDEEGAFGATVDVPESTAEGDVRIAASYDGAESNIEPADAGEVVTFPSDTSSRSWRGIPVWAWIGSGLLLLFGSGTAAWWYRSRKRQLQERSPDVTPETIDEPAVSSEGNSDPTQSLLARASDHLSNDRTNEAVEVAYAAVRYALSDRVDANGALTHWEFYRRVPAHETSLGVDQDGGDGGGPSDDGNSDGDDDGDPLLTVTERYERASFDVADIPPDEAADTLERARRLCSGNRDADGRSSADD